jgi:hypothetical protein
MGMNVELYNVPNGRKEIREVETSTCGNETSCSRGIQIGGVNNLTISNLRLVSWLKVQQAYNNKESVHYKM